MARFQQLMILTLLIGWQVQQAGATSIRRKSLFRPSASGFSNFRPLQNQVAAVTEPEPEPETKEVITDESLPHKQVNNRSSCSSTCPSLQIDAGNDARRPIEISSSSSPSVEKVTDKDATSSLLLLSQRPPKKRRGRKRKRVSEISAAQEQQRRKQQRRGKEREGVDGEKCHTDASVFRLKGRMAITKLTWRLDPEAMEQYARANKLFKKRRSLGRNQRGHHHFQLSKAEEDNLGTEGLKLYYALISKFTNRCTSDKRDRPPKARRWTSTKWKRPTDYENQLRTLLRKLREIEEEGRRGTGFQQGDLETILELASSKKYQKTVETILALFLRQAPTIDRHWHEDILKFYGEEDRYPDISDGNLSQVRAWLIKFGIAEEYKDTLET